MCTQNRHGLIEEIEQNKTRFRNEIYQINANTLVQLKKENNKESFFM